MWAVRDASHRFVNTFASETPVIIYLVTSGLRPNCATRLAHSVDMWRKRRRWRRRKLLHVRCTNHFATQRAAQQSGLWCTMGPRHHHFRRAVVVHVVQPHLGKRAHSRLILATEQCPVGGGQSLDAGMALLRRRPGADGGADQLRRSLWPFGRWGGERSWSPLCSTCGAKHCIAVSLLLDPKTSRETRRCAGFRGWLCT